MVRGIYTAASGMMATMKEMNSVANNLANINTDGYKKETTVLKSFPEMLIRRINSDGLTTFPLGSYDVAPVVGKLGTGVELNEAFIRFDQGSLQQTDNDFDFALEGQGFLTVKTPNGERYTRNGSFSVNNDGYLVDKRGNQVMGERGAIRIGRNNFKIDEEGNVYINSDYTPEDFVQKPDNEWKNMVKLDKLKLVDFRHKRYLKKEGYTLYRATEFSGKATIVGSDSNLKVHQGFLEKANVNPVREMTRMIEIQRAYESNQKVIRTQDEALGKAVNQVGRGLG